MKNTFFSVLAFLLVFASISCKSDPKKEAATTSSETISEATQKQNNSTAVNTSVMVKIMTAPELKSLASALVGAGLAENLMNDSATYTIFAPTTSGFNAVSKVAKEKYKNVKNKEEYATVLKNHLYAGIMSSADLLQAIKPTGSFVIRTAGGAELTATLDGENIVITDSNGIRAVLGKSDIQGSNGMVHMIDRVLSIPSK